MLFAGNNIHSWIAYCCHTINKKLKCDSCKQRIICSVGDVDNIENILIAEATRGGLLYPCLEVVHIFMLSYVIVNQLAPQKVFLNCPYQRKLVVECTMNALESEDFWFMHRPNCPNGHSDEKIIKMVTWILTNTLLKVICHQICHFANFVFFF